MTNHVIVMDAGYLFSYLLERNTPTHTKHVSKYPFFFFLQGIWCYCSQIHPALQQIPTPTALLNFACDWLALDEDISFGWLTSPNVWRYIPIKS